MKIKKKREKKEKNNFLKICKPFIEEGETAQCALQLLLSAK